MRRGIVPAYILCLVSKAFVFMMNFLSVLLIVPNEPRVNNSSKKKKKLWDVQDAPITNKETILVIERGSDIVSAHFQGP